ncbi:Phage P22-like portal protein [uncultured Caudovirales phage]|uniref:Phage P22-like portal protein n=1 Tax=uncultured Caudovirales phage TaxID=2100421 RepID=A0A6J5L0D6_9CAUD|nr:Phage P22-like portal protein [uncultured Caudovirales phage]
MEQNDLLDIHERAMAEFNRIQSAMRDERMQCLQDRRFYSLAGAQWEGSLGIQFQDKPMLEINKIHLAIIRIINEYRNNSIGVFFLPKDGSADESIADTCSSLFRADEQYSTAQEAYDNAFEEAVGGGFGAWRLRTEYVDEYGDGDEQRIIIEPIPDADSCVFFNLDAKRQDKSDATSCFVLSSMTKEAYREAWGDDPSTMPKLIHQRHFDWLTPDIVYIAEYYVVEEKKVRYRVFSGAPGSVYESETINLPIEKDEDNDLEEKVKELLATGYVEKPIKRKKTKKIHKYILSGSKVLEDCGYIAGKNIPIVPVYGKRWFIDNVERCMGHVRLAKDAQRLKNLQMSKLAEISAMSPVEKPIFTPEQIAGHQNMWAEDHIRNHPYLLVNQLTDLNGNPAAIGPTNYSHPPQVPPAMAALLQLTEEDIRDVLGNQQQADKMVSNISGNAIEMIQQHLDMQTYIYVSNFAKGRKRCGDIWLSMAKEVYVEDGRSMRGINTSGNSENILLNKPDIGKSGEFRYKNDLSKADMEVSVSVGPSSESKKNSMVKSLVNILPMTQDQQTQQVLISMILMNLEGEGIKDIRDYFRNNLLRMGAVKPTEEERQRLEKEAANQKPDPNTAFLEASAREAEANAALKQANTDLTIAKTKQAEIDAMASLGAIDMSQRDQLLRSIDMLNSHDLQQKQLAMQQQQSLLQNTAQLVNTGGQNAS